MQEREEQTRVARGVDARWHRGCWAVCAEQTRMTATQTNLGAAAEATSSQAVQMPLGLLGFESTKRYALISDPGEAPFQWLQMLDAPGLAFLVIPPSCLLLDYRPEISNDDASFLDLKDSSDAMVLNIVTLRPQGVTTVNLKGPVVVNRHTWIAKQVVLVNAADYALQQPLPVSE